MFMPTYLLYVQHILYLSQLMCIIFSHLDHWHGFCQIFLQESQLLAWIFSYSPPPSALSLAAPPTILCLFFWKPPKILSKKNNTARENQSPRTKSLSQPLYVTSVCYRLRLFVILSFCRRFSSVHYYYYYIPIYLCFKCISWNSLY